MATRAQLIQLAHVAKRELALNDDAYRAAIDSVAKGKTSCAQLLDRELETLLESFKAAGFKRRVNRAKKPRLSPASGVPVKVAEITKIRAIWITMHQHGFVRDGSETALNSYVQRMTVNLNGGVGVAEVGWLDEALAFKVLDALVKNERRVPANPQTGKPAGYRSVLDAYEVQHGVNV
jgi:phage gp16-like protein